QSVARTLGLAAGADPEAQRRLLPARPDHQRDAHRLPDVETARVRQPLLAGLWTAEKVDARRESAVAPGHGNAVAPRARHDHVDRRAAGAEEDRGLTPVSERRVVRD